MFGAHFRTLCSWKQVRESNVRLEFPIWRFCPFRHSAGCRVPVLACSWWQFWLARLLVSADFSVHNPLLCRRVSHIVSCSIPFRCSVLAIQPTHFVCYQCHSLFYWATSSHVRSFLVFFSQKFSLNWSDSLGSRSPVCSNLYGATSRAESYQCPCPAYVLVLLIHLQITLICSSDKFGFCRVRVVRHSITFTSASEIGSSSRSNSCKVHSTILPNHFHKSKVRNSRVAPVKSSHWIISDLSSDPVPIFAQFRYCSGAALFWEC